MVARYWENGNGDKIISNNIVVIGDYFDIEKCKYNSIKKEYYRINSKDYVIPWHTNFLYNPYAWHHKEEMIEMLGDLKEQLDVGLEIEMWIANNNI